MLIVSRYKNKVSSWSHKNNSSSNDKERDDNKDMRSTYQVGPSWGTLSSKESFLSLEATAQSEESIHRHKKNKIIERSD